MASGSGGNQNHRDRNTSRSQGDDLDFGAFVSERVRSSSARLKGTPQEPADTTQPETPVSRPTPPPSSDPTPSRRQRPSRYWRDSLRQSTGEEVDEEESTSRRFIGTGASSRPPSGSGDAEARTGEGGGGDVPWWQSLMSSDDDDDRNRTLIMYGVIGLVLLALMIFAITRLFGGDSGGGVDPTPTPTVTEEADIVIPSTPAVIPDDDEEEPTETPEIRRGGDNQIPSDSDTPAGDAPELESEVALACSAECLIRITDDNATEVLQETGNRPSFVGEDVAWAVVSPREAEELDMITEISLVEDSEQTYNLYVITAPSGSVDPALASQYGDVVDSTGAHTLVAFATVPAPVRSLLDNGHEVHKLAPAPPREVADASQRPPVNGVDAEALMGAVDSGNLSDTMDDLSSMGELDSSGLGTRYYALPGNQIAADYLFQELESYGLDVWFEDFVSWDGLLLVNVVAEVPGRDNSEAWAVMSHFDSINTTNPRQAPGADDNATGMAVNLETARILVGYEPEHPIRFVFVNAEEVGIQGALAWARRANAEGINVQGVLNVDSVGSARQYSYVVTNADDTSAWLQSELSAVNEQYGLGQTVQHVQDDDIVADDNMLRKEGIDAVMIARELYGWTPFHHTSDDTMENVSIDSVTSMTYLTMLTIIRLAG